MDTFLWAEGLLTDKLLPSCDSFHYFAYLPAEIRHEIWSRALPHRILRFTTIREISAPAYNHLLSAPPVAHVCKDARRVALRTGAWRHITSPKVSTGNLVREALEIEVPGGKMRTGQQRCTYTWFDTARDALFLDKHNLLAQAQELRELAETVIYAGFRCDEMSIFHMDTFINKHQWPRLRSIEVTLNAAPEVKSSYMQQSVYIIRPVDVPGLLQSLSVFPYWGADLQSLDEEVSLQYFLAYTQPSFGQHPGTEVPASAIKGLHYTADGFACKCRMRSWRKFKSDVRFMWLWFQNCSEILSQVHEGEELMTVPFKELKNLGWTEKFNYGHSWIRMHMEKMHDTRPMLRPVLQWTGAVIDGV
ncbi:hypothetical protein BKA67DRAFT_418587 [Truncatella angustata]|uniref:2EXR domain-containing protein n=1 Tax=Truncatella angustata TaxID=152316 RepID=A0A9P8RMD5_9PEZI|nr:uncharacterized protein BKA67DRAFT_418587 [Truncatella angustata]KAH6646888.1 hypothetical protein BKA67DRAFT_418587 [Truncatella angustata]